MGAPVGSMLVGSKKFIEMARIYRKALGGGMRQAGILAAAGMIALEKMPERLREDHANAKFLAQGLAEIPGIKIDAAKVQTNILIFDISGTGMKSDEFTRKLGERQVLAGGVNPELVRFVTHMDVDRSGCERALEVVRAVCAGRSRARA
jgi:threonine aldolase